MIKSPNTSFLTLILILTSLILVSSTSAQTEYDIELTYIVTESNNNTIAWYVPPMYIESFNYHIESGSEIDVGIYDAENNNTLIDIEVGNLTRTGIPDSEPEETMILGHYLAPAVFGFMAYNDWNEVSSILSELTVETVEFERSVTYELDGEEKDAVSIWIEGGGQNTTLLYDETKGFLIKATTSFGNYGLAISLREVTDNTSAVNELLPIDGLNLLVIASLTSSIVAKKLFSFKIKK